MEQVPGLSAVLCDVISDSTIWCVDENDKIFKHELGKLKIQAKNHYALSMKHSMFCHFLLDNLA